MHISKVLLLLGGNESGTPELITNAVQQIKSLAGEILKQSSDYQSSAWGFQSNQPFINRVVEIATTLAPENLIQITQQIERNLGRERNSNLGYSNRGIDIDILFFDDAIINTATLSIPHPRLHLRRFTLLPLCEHWENQNHPIFQKTLNKLLTECKDDGFVIRIS